MVANKSISRNLIILGFMIIIISKLPYSTITR